MTQGAEGRGLGLHQVTWGRTAGKAFVGNSGDNITLDLSAPTGQLDHSAPRGQLDFDRLGQHRLLVPMPESRRVATEQGGVNNRAHQISDTGIQPWQSHNLANLSSSICPCCLVVAIASDLPIAAPTKSTAPASLTLFCSAGSDDPILHRAKHALSNTRQHQGDAACLCDENLVVGVYCEITYYAAPNMPVAPPRNAAYGCPALPEAAGCRLHVR